MNLRELTEEETKNLTALERSYALVPGENPGPEEKEKRKAETQRHLQTFHQGALVRIIRNGFKPDHIEGFRILTYLELENYRESLERQIGKKGPFAIYGTEYYFKQGMEPN